MARRLYGYFIAAVVLLSGRAGADTGPYILPGWHNFYGPTLTRSDYVVGTYYFYWYNIHTRDHIVNLDGSDALTDHPLESQPYPVPPEGYAHRPPARYFSPPPFSNGSSAWHAREAQRMWSAGIDFMMPVYWGVPGVRDWNNIGLQRLDYALNTLDRFGQRAPSVGLFYDTTTLAGVDLTTQAGRDQFYGTIRDFFSWILPFRWTRFDGRALVWLYWSGWPSRIDPNILTYASNKFAKQFGGVRLFFVGDAGWRNAGAKLDLTYSWGAAVTGTTLNDVAAVGAGYDDRGVTYRTSHIVVPRNNGDFYRNAWETVHASGRRIVAVETWNEYHEGTEVAPTYEDGWLYTNITGAESIRHRFPAYFVPQAYRYLLGRNPDPGGYESYTRAMDSGLPCSGVRDSILDSPEARNRTSDRNFVTFLYARYLNRKPDPGGYTYWVDLLAHGARRSFVRDAFLNSVEARSRISDTQFVTELYRQILLREPDPGGFRNWMDWLRKGQTRSFVRDGFVNSRELRYHDVSQLTGSQRAALFDYSGWRP